MKEINSILCVITSWQDAPTSIAQSLNLAQDHQATLSFLIFPEEEAAAEIPLLDDELYQNGISQLAENEKLKLGRQVQAIDPSVEYSVEVLSGTVFIDVIRAVKRNQHDLVIKCAEDTDWLDRMFGSDDMHLFRKCPCPVLMLKPGQTGEFRSVLATVDVDDEPSDPDKAQTQLNLNRQVLKYSAALCMPELSDLHVASVWRAFAERFMRDSAFSHASDDKVDNYVQNKQLKCSAALDGLIAELADELGSEGMGYLDAKKHLIKGRASREIPRIAKELGSDLVVMGTVGRTGIPGLLIGNTAESILEQVQCSVLGIKPDGFESPID
ncbi:universal stress protein [Granulosicoccaceae sp. 1_MG-2023]|nr:universal stress protein [Granulosicoccaceae sp. 1_MG-2023]